MKRRFLSFLLLAGWLSGCGEERPVAFRFVDHFKPEMVEGSEEVGRREIPRTEWRFDGTIATTNGKLAATYGWQAGHGVAGLMVREGRLVGRSTLDFPVIHVERTSGLDDPDLVHAVEVRLKVSAGANLALERQSSEKPDIDRAVGRAQGISCRPALRLLRVKSSGPILCAPRSPLNPLPSGICCCGRRTRRERGSRSNPYA
ncbi:MAG: hypothetical protein O6850_00765 [Acidobacteria bacterium]|nr:hypothetical protein [Acidobacteriota bacterium]